MNWEYALLPSTLKSRSLVVLSFLWLLWVFPAFAIDNSASKLIDYLIREKTHLTIGINEVKQLDEPADQNDLIARQKKNEAMLMLLRAKITTLENILATQYKQQQELSERLKTLQQPENTTDPMLIQERISHISALNEVHRKTIELITQNLDLAHQYEKALLAEKQQLSVWQGKLQEQQKLDDLRKRIKVLEEARLDLYQKNVELEQQKTVSTNKTLYYEAKLMLNNQVMMLIQHRITELELRKKLIKADFLLLKNQDIKTIQSVIETYKSAIEELVSMENSLKKMSGLLKSEKPLLSEHGLQSQFLNLQKTFVNRIQEIVLQQQTLQEDLDSKQKQFKRQLSARQRLSEYNLETWSEILKQIAQIPSQFYNYLKLLILKVRDNYLWQGNLAVTFLWGSLSLIFALGFGLHRLLQVISKDKERSRLSAHLYDGLITLLQHNIPHLCFLAACTDVFFINQIPLAPYRLLFNLFLVWLIFRNLILSARLMLLERVSDASGKDVRFYYRLKWLLLVGGWLTGLMIFARQLPLPLLLQDLSDRLFMSFLLALSIVLWKSKEAISYLLRPFLQAKKRYIRNAVMLLVVLAPLTVFITAVIGLNGYLNLAWTMGRYQIYLLLIITGYVLARGLLFDALELFSEWMISTLHNGWLWIEVVLKPLDKILRVLLLLASTALLFQLFGWYTDSWVVTRLMEWGSYPFVNISGVHITLISSIEFLILLFIFVWAAKWTREFSYRWLYRNAKDTGIRNSLSVFTQYAVILVGSLITLRVLGLDFSGMSMVLGGLAVGMGFGLRDFASNIVGGFMLLIERPVREGDLITLGEYEGRVEHIGIRSMRVCSWDNMEVLIPNAETFNKSFTNWTHQDSVVRTVIPIKVCRADDPVIVQQLILDVLAVIPEILSEPAPQVLLTEIDEALIEFEVRYFINVQLYTRFEIRSKVLFAITAQFKAAGIKPPIPPLRIEMGERDTEDYVNRQKSTEERS